jgi:hypothetical protein
MHFSDIGIEIDVEWVVKWNIALTLYYTIHERILYSRNVNISVAQNKQETELDNAR